MLLCCSCLCYDLPWGNPEGINKVSHSYWVTCNPTSRFRGQTYPGSEKMFAVMLQTWYFLSFELCSLSGCTCFTSMTSLAIEKQHDSEVWLLMHWPPVSCALGKRALKCVCAIQIELGWKCTADSLWSQLAIIMFAVFYFFFGLKVILTCSKVCSSATIKGCPLSDYTRHMVIRVVI